MAEETTQQEAPKKKPKRLEKDLVKHPGKVAISVIGGEKGEMIFDPKTLPKSIQDQLPAFALNHKLGDAAAGRSGKEAEEAITKVWDGMMAGDWTVRAPAQPKVAVNEVAQNFDKLSEKEKKAAAPLLKSLGLSIPGITD
jgi:hypothetical protein